MQAEQWMSRQQKSSATMKRIMVRCLDMQRRGVSSDQFALVITNDEALDIINGMIENGAVAIGAVAWMKEALAREEGWAISGRLNFNGYMVCVKR